MKKIAIVLAAIMITACAMVTVVACDNKNETHDFTVTVLDVDGSPRTDVTLQPCRVDENGIQGSCFNIFQKVDTNGVGYFDCGKDGKDGKDTVSDDATRLAIHVYNSKNRPLPAYLTYKSEVVEKGKSVQIKLKEKGTDDLLTLDEIKEGTGKAEYNDNALNVSNSAPYKVDFKLDEENGCRLAFNVTLEAGKTLLFELPVEPESTYKVYAKNSTNVKIMKLASLTKSTEDGDNVKGEGELSFSGKTENRYIEVSSDATSSDTFMLCFEVD